MIIYKHRVNDFLDLKNYRNVEIDVKSDGKDLILGHNWNEDRGLLEDYLRCCDGHNLAINVKQSGLCNELDLILNKYKKNVSSYFFFDMSIADLQEYISICPRQTAFRMSEFENYIFKDCGYIWLDYFDYRRLEFKDYEKLNSRYKIIIVSPELHKFSDIFNYSDLKKFYGVCTDYV